MPYKDDDLDDFDKAGKEGFELPEELERYPEEEVRSREVKIVGVFEDPGQAYFVLLRDSLDRQLPILIGPFEAHAIALGFQGPNRVTPRPFTHDLLKNVIERLGAKIDRLTIDSLFQETYYAKLSLLVGDRITDIDCRPSDGIALAVRAGAPIYVAEPVLEEVERSRQNRSDLEDSEEE